jgi:lantibiotic modifying enzyme
MLAAVPYDAGFRKILLEDIDKADRFVREYSTEGRDHLCCGRTAGIDFLIEKSVRLGDKEALEFAKRGMRKLLNEKAQRGRYCLVASDGKYLSNITLFQGTAGIGYEMLRLAAPQTIPSILI